MENIVKIGIFLALHWIIKTIEGNEERFGSSLKKEFLNKILDIL